jgi:hypothetical protein
MLQRTDPRLSKSALACVKLRAQPAGWAATMLSEGHACQPLSPCPRRLTDVAAQGDKSGHVTSSGRLPSLLRMMRYGREAQRTTTVVPFRATRGVGGKALRSQKVSAASSFGALWYQNWHSAQASTSVLQAGVRWLPLKVVTARHLPRPWMPRRRRSRLQRDRAVLARADVCGGHHDRI